MDKAVVKTVGDRLRGVHQCDALDLVTFVVSTTRGQRHSCSVALVRDLASALNKHGKKSEK